MRNRSVVLNSRDIALFRKALESMLTPIAHSTPEQWGLEVMRAVAALLGADQMLFALPLDGEIRLVGHGERTAEAAQQYADEYWQTDFVVATRRKELGLEVYHRDELYHPGELRNDILHNEWCVPNKLFDTLGMGVQVSNTTIPAGVHAYHNAGSKEFGVRGHLLMEMLLPAFRASVKSYALLLQNRECVGRLIDSITVGVCVIDMRGSVAHVNPALARLKENDRHWQQVHEAIERAARLLVETHIRQSSTTAIPETNASETVSTPSTSYEIRCSLVTDLPELPGSLGLVFVQAVEDDTAKMHSRAEKMAARFGLTKREAEVALLLIQRLHTNEIAEMLRISSHTVRHHTETIFRKTGIGSRSELVGLASGLRERESQAG